jgi:flagellum-specific ATP synthase
MALYDDMAELIRLGAYKSGSDPETDRAILLNPALEAFLGQQKGEQAGLGTSFAALRDVLHSGQTEGLHT